MNVHELLEKFITYSYKDDFNKNTKYYKWKLNIDYINIVSIGIMDPKKVTVTLQFQFRKSKVEIDSLIKKTDLYELAKKQLCFKEDYADLSEYLYDNDLKKWKGVASAEELTLEEGMKFKWKKHIPVIIMVMHSF